MDARSLGALLVASTLSEDGRVRQQAVAALGRVGGARAVEVLIFLLQDRDGEVREGAALALAEIAARDPVPGLWAALPALRRLRRRQWLARSIANPVHIQPDRSVYREAIRRIEEGVGAVWKSLPVPTMTPAALSEESLPVPARVQAPPSSADLPVLAERPGEEGEVDTLTGYQRPCPWWMRPRR